MLKFGLLKREQIDGKSAFFVLGQYGLNAAATDLAVLLGGIRSENKCTRDGKPICAYWTQTPLPGEMVLCTSVDNTPMSCYAYERWPSVRPVIPASEASKIQLKKSRDGVGETTIYKHGEFPQTIADDETTRELEALYQKRQLLTTGKIYTFDSTRLEKLNTEFTAKEHAEYEHNGHKYIRVLARPYDSDAGLSDKERAEVGGLCQLSNGEKAQADKYYWVRVEPLEWLLNKETGDLISLKAILAGLQLDSEPRYVGRFQETSLYRYLTDFFAKEMEPSKTMTRTIKRLKSSSSSKKNSTKKRGFITTDRGEHQ